MLVSANSSTGKPNVRRQDSVDFDVVVLGATGLTGRLVVEQLLQVDASLRSPEGIRRWAVAGRDPKRVADMLAELGAKDIDILTADLRDQSSLNQLASRTAVVLNLAGPYTQSAEQVIAACVETGASYADLSGELPLLRRVIDRFDGPARKAGVQIVQMAGWEAVPADLTTLVACQRAVQQQTGEAPTADGPGAGAPMTRVTVVITYQRVPSGGVPLKQSVSAGTLASIVEILADPDSAIVGRTGGLLPQPAPGAALRMPSPLRLRPYTLDGRVLATVAPIAFLNPPIVHRTAALLAAEQGVIYRPAIYLEGTDSGAAGGLRGRLRSASALVKVGFQRLLIGVARLPLFLRRLISAGVRKVLPKAGTGPTGNYLRDWEWTVEARAVTDQGKIGSAVLQGKGHPGYTATAALIVEVGLRLAKSSPQASRVGCLTPATALGVAGAEQLQMPSLTLR